MQREITYEWSPEPVRIARLTINRPFFVTNSVLILLWCLFLAASGALVYITAREPAGSARRKANVFSPG